MRLCTQKVVGETLLPRWEKPGFGAQVLTEADSETRMTMQVTNLWRRASRSWGRDPRKGRWPVKHVPGSQLSLWVSGA